MEQVKTVIDNQAAETTLGGRLGFMNRFDSETPLCKNAIDSQFLVEKTGIGFQSRARLFAHRDKDAAGLVGQMLRQGVRYGTTIESLRAVATEDHFYGAVVITGFEHEVGANIADASSRPLYSDPIPRIEVRDLARPTSSTRKQFVVSVGLEEDLIVTADTARLVGINIGYCDVIRRKDGAEGVEILEAEFHLDVPPDDSSLFEVFVELVLAREARGDLDLITRTWDLD